MVISTQVKKENNKKEYQLLSDFINQNYEHNTMIQAELIVDSIERGELFKFIYPLKKPFYLCFLAKDYYFGKKDDCYIHRACEVYLVKENKPIKRIYGLQAMEKNEEINLIGSLETITKTILKYQSTSINEDDIYIEMTKCLLKYQEKKLLFQTIMRGVEQLSEPQKTTYHIPIQSNLVLLMEKDIDDQITFYMEKQGEKEFLLKATNLSYYSFDSFNSLYILIEQIKK